MQIIQILRAFEPHLLHGSVCGAHYLQLANIDFWLGIVGSRMWGRDGDGNYCVLNRPCAFWTDPISDSSDLNDLALFRKIVSVRASSLGPTNLSTCNAKSLLV